MTQKRCFLPDPEQPGALHLLTVAADDYCAPLQLCCFKEALEKWQVLFTVQILEYSFSELGVVMLAHVPNVPISAEEARCRTSAFDCDLRNKQRGLWRPRNHDYAPEELNSISKFMQIFVRDFMERHKRHPVPKGLPEGCRPYPQAKERYKSRTVQYDALPPIFDLKQLATIRRQLSELGFSSNTQALELRELYVSPHGIGTWSFLEGLEHRCADYLFGASAKIDFWGRYPWKKIVPFHSDVWDRCLFALLQRRPHMRHPKVCGLLQGLGMVKASLLSPESFRNTEMDSHLALDGMVWACLPISMTLMLSDGLLRWYYKSRKGVEFPYYSQESWER